MALASAAAFATPAVAQDDKTIKPAAGVEAGAKAAPKGAKTGVSATNLSAPAGDSGATRPSSENSAAEVAPGQKQKSGAVDSAADAAPGQLRKSGEVDSASEAAPGQIKKGVSEETTASIDLSAERRTEFRRIIVESNVKPVSLDIGISPGVTIPTTVTLYRLPPRVVEIVPAYRGYQYFVLADGQIVIVEPSTLEVVYILPV